MTHGYRMTAWGLAFVFGCASSVTGQGGVPAGNAVEATEDAIDWLKIVPGDVGFYAELRDLAGIRRRFLELGIWAAVRRMSEPDLGLPSSQPGRLRGAELLGLNTESAISLILGRRAAVIASSSSRWRDGVVLAELKSASDVGPLLARWQARPQPDVGPVKLYLLKGDLHLAVLDRTIIFGPAGDHEGIWGRTVQLLAGKIGSTLAGRSEFAGLRARLTRDYPGLLYVVWSPKDATAVGGCDRLLVGVDVGASEIVCELRGHREISPKDRPCFDAATLGALPADSALVWSAAFDFSSLTGELTTGAARDGDALLRYSLKVLSAPGEGGEDLRQRLGPRYAVVVGTEGSTASEAKSAPVIPRVTVLVETDQGEECVDRLDRVLGFLGRAYLMYSLRVGEAMKSPVISERDFEGIMLHEMDLGRHLAGRTGWPFLDSVQPCWVWFDGRLVVSTSSRHVEEIVQAARRMSPRLDDGGSAGGLLPGEAGGETVAEWICLRGEAVASMFTSWLNYARREHPEVLKPQWWRRWAAERIEQRGRLGVGLVDAKGGRQALVLEVLRDSPALGHLRVGDVIVAVMGEALPEEQAAREVARRYFDRGAVGEFELEVLRGGERKTVKIPVPPTLDLDLRGFDPVNAVRQVIALARPAETVTAWRYASGPNRYDARILIRWKAIKPQRSSGKAGRTGGAESGARP